MKGLRLLRVLGFLLLVAQALASPIISRADASSTPNPEDEG
jgi:hypothetical protein